jgi:ABC-type cobalamin/Fe3+-siderophores transport system ATPase subunit
MDKGKIVKYGLSKETIKLDVLKDIYGNKICYSKDLPYDEISFKD